MNMGTRIREEREALGLTQEELARRAGVSRTMISEIEKDPNRGTTRLVAIARALKVEPAYLESGKEPKHPAIDPLASYVSASSLDDLAQKLIGKGDKEIAKLLQRILELKSRK
ncbi:helix-turn-helix domain-containing protein [Paludibacterium purpuratum]|uniref:Helix-turn-helix protein n=1 Tax=Paludibacterium purpuratum TaxID=1144873 RepID=A0A4R7BB30_9NEIS|nr:helix-turn-helix transcriptional regulator [Paludibacterium purpuratum]TDR82180.1 helix-turn-helix protein [Paludibacterium purpuratum]